jgi:hypothetical protein
MILSVLPTPAQKNVQVLCRYFCTNIAKKAQKWTNFAYVFLLNKYKEKGLETAK